ncbi:MAG: hypothetical protein ACTSRI_10070 [Promethearchaeota archaeon]
MLASSFPSEPIEIVVVIIAFIVLGFILVIPLVGTASVIAIFIALLVAWDTLEVDEMLLYLFITLAATIAIDSALIPKNKYYLIHVAMLTLLTSLIAWLLWSEPLIVLVIVGIISLFAIIAVFKKDFLFKTWNKIKKK